MKQLGPVEPGVQNAVPSATASTVEENELPPLGTLQNLDEFETTARKVVSRKAWVYFSSATDTLASYKKNRLDWSKVTLRPRVLRNVGRITMKRTIMGHDSDLPFFIAPAAQARLGHEDGELCLARGAARYNIPYCSSTYTSVAHKELADCMKAEQKGGALLYQLYVPVNKPNAKYLVADAVKLGYKALVLTVDSAVIGKREEDDRYKAELDYDAVVVIERSLSTEGDVPIVRGSHSSTLEWNDLSWIREAWGNIGPVILKGIQTAEDAAMAAEAGVHGIYLSNHGGRQMDYAPSSLQTLLEIRKFYPDLINKLEIYLDGGVTRGSDVLKAIALGARAVGIGRPFMYALSGYGTEGVCRAIERTYSNPRTATFILGEANNLLSLE